jgi:four helix bundle protein
MKSIMRSRHLDLQDRLIRFAVSVLRLVQKMPGSPDARHLSGQLMRSDTSPALNYGEVLGAESRKDFIHKMKIVLKELRESLNTLHIIDKMEYTNLKEVNSTLQECNELVAIFVQSLKTADGNKAA